jgi:Xaa-Pro aminopeptidase
MMSVNKMERIQRLVAAGQARGVDWILCTLPENIFYFSGFRTLLYNRFIGVLVPVKVKREPVLIVSFIDRKIVEEKFWSPHWFTEVAMWGPTADESYKTHWEALKAYLQPGISLGVDAIQYDSYEQLVQAFPGLRVTNVQNDILSLRMVKDEDEIQKVAQAFTLTEKVMAMIPGWLQKPMTEAELAAEIYRAARLGGAEEIFYPVLVSCGSKMLAFHSPALPRPIKENELLRVALGFQAEGYGSDMVRTFCKGRVPADAVPLKEAYFEAQEAVFEMLRPGVRSSQLLTKVEEIYRRRNCLKNWLNNNIGHGIALTVHEPPRIAGTDDTVIQENMLLAIEPVVSCPPHGAIAHCDGVRITAQGCMLLSSSMRDIVII